MVPGPYPSLTLALDFDPGSSRQVSWSIASADSAEASFDLARRSAGRSWEAERAHIELLDAGDTLDIHTGDIDWDAAFAFSQRAALGLFFTPDKQLPNPSFVQSRQPDHGFSPKGDGRDYAPGWSGQSPLESYYLTNVIPASSQLTRGIISNFLFTQTEDGSIDYKPGIAGQRGKLTAAPMLASLAWRYFQQTEDEAFLGRSLSQATCFFHGLDFAATRSSAMTACLLGITCFKLALKIIRFLMSGILGPKAQIFLSCMDLHWKPCCIKKHKVSFKSQSY